MRLGRIDDAVRGWIVGDFDPVILRDSHCEVAIKSYRAGEVEPAHYHAVATELTAVVSGEVMMCGTRLVAGDVIVVEPGEVTDFACLADAVSVVVKLPSVAGDKYVVG